MSSIVKDSGGLAPAFENNPYKKLNKLFADSESDFYLYVSDNYLKKAVASLLIDKGIEERNGNYENFNKFYVSLSMGTFNLINEFDSDINIYQLPIQWSDMIFHIDDYLEDNPIIKKEPVVKNPDNWNIPRGSFIIEEEKMDNISNILSKISDENDESEVGDIVLKSECLSNDFDGSEEYIYIVGMHHNNILEIEDDFTMFNILEKDATSKCLSHETMFESDGFVSIIRSDEEFNKILDELSIHNSDVEGFGVKIKNFKGSINVGIYNIEDNTSYTLDELGLDTSDYISHQIDFNHTVYLILDGEYESIEKL